MQYPDYSTHSPNTLTILRIVAVAAVMMGGLTYLATTLYRLQIVERAKWVQRVENQQIVNVRIPPARGMIMDRGDNPWDHSPRDPIPLAENRVSYDIDFYMETLVRHYKGENKGDVPMKPITVRDRKKNMLETVEVLDIAKIVQNCLEPIAQSLGMKDLPDAKEIENHYRRRGDLPFQFKTDVDWVLLSQFSERNLGVPGIEIVARPVRQYKYGALAAHILGYVGKPENESAENAKAEDNVAYETVGRQGIESKMDVRLQGRPGAKAMRVNSRGDVMQQDAEVTYATMGDNVALTLDARMQYIVEQTMRSVGRGACVIMDPRNGDVLAMVSVPSFDPNEFIPKIKPSDWNRLNNDPTNPMVNRATSPYPPGSIYKIMIALAALKAGAITPNTVFNCPASLYIGNREFKNWTKVPLGSARLKEGIRMSNNPYFYQVGIKTGISALVAMGKLVGFGEPTGIGIPEYPGILPGPQWLIDTGRKTERWTEAYTANFSIGQGAVATTPLQMCVMMSAVANGGTVYQPRIINAFYDQNMERRAVPPVVTRSTLDVKKSDIDAIKEGLIAVVEGGTGKNARLTEHRMGGKTGTAQSWSRLNGRTVKDNRTWFLGYGPIEDPRYVVCVMVEGGQSGGSTCAPLFAEIMKQVFALEKGEKVDITYLTPAVGHFKGVDETAPAPGSNSGATTTTAAAATPAPARAAADEPAVVEEDDKPVAARPSAPPPPPSRPAMPPRRSSSIPSRF
ncbi:MAG: penicillin-binding protein 2 [Candidatus Methylacidiphilales bacterium]|nr:penicillin-binding protein 2 [Candidatus Methylacidiphilales bacterium]